MSASAALNGNFVVSKAGEAYALPTSGLNQSFKCEGDSLRTVQATSKLTPRPAVKGRTGNWGLDMTNNLRRASCVFSPHFCQIMNKMEETHNDTHQVFENRWSYHSIRCHYSRGND